MFFFTPESIFRLFAEDQVDIMYKLFDDSAEIHLIKKTVYDKDNTEYKKFIPEYITKL